MNKENDLFLNMLSNPTYGINDLMMVGLTADNTSIAPSEDVYKNLPFVQQNPMLQNEKGEFDDAKFHNLFLAAANNYTTLANNTTKDVLVQDLATYSKYNIFASPDLKNMLTDFKIVKQPNPLKQKSSLSVIGKSMRVAMTADEIAQTRMVLANPTEAYNPDGSINEDKAIWHEAPNDSFFTDFFDTRVMASWDYDADSQGNRTSDPAKIVHHKGDLKVDNEGCYYYENLDGRDIYGKRVLNKMNTITTDGSFANKFDFLDSDGFEKSAGGTLMKNLALVGSMFVPYVGPVVAVSNILMQGANMMTVLGKMATGSDSPTLSAIEGWTKSWDRQGLVSENSQLNMWTMENMINLIGDVAGQIKELRVLFKYAPAIFKGKWGMSEENQKLLEKKLFEGYNQNITTEELLTKAVTKGKPVEAIKKQFEQVAAIKASLDLKSYVKGYNKIGEVLSKFYMTGLTVGDTYGEAKELGASDLEATILTLGYGSAEAALLNTGLGEWMLPELRAEGIHQSAIAKALVGVKNAARKMEADITAETTEAGQKAVKNNFFKKVFNSGKEICRDLWTANKSTGEKTVGNLLANSLGEGFEETSEEALKDFSIGCFNLVNWMRGDDTHLRTNWRDSEGNWTIGNALSDYAMNAVGGFIGGGIAGLDINTVNAIKNAGKMTSQQAWQNLVEIATDPKQESTFRKNINKYQIGSKNLSAVNFNEDGSPKAYDPNDSNDINLDQAAKKIVFSQLDFAKAMLQSTGVSMSPDSFLDGQTEVVKDLKIAGLQNTYAAAGLSNRFREINTALVELAASSKNAPVVANPNLASDSLQSKLNKENGINAGSTDIEKIEAGLSEDNKAKFEELLKEKKDLLDGKYTAKFIEDALFELTMANFMAPATFIRFAESMENKKFDKIPTERIPELKQAYTTWLQEGKPGFIEKFRGAYQKLSRDGSKTFSLFDKSFRLLLEQDPSAFEQIIQQQYGQAIDAGLLNMGLSEISDQDWLNFVQQQVIGESELDLNDIKLLTLGRSIITDFGTDNETSELSNLITEQSTYHNNYAEAKSKVAKLLEKLKNTTTLDEIDDLQDLILQQKYIAFEQLELSTNSSKSIRNFVYGRSRKNFSKLLKKYNKQGWVNSETKNAILNLKSLLVRQARRLDDLATDLNSPSLSGEFILSIQEDLYTFESLQRSPIEQLLNLWSISTTGQELNLTELLEFSQKVLGENASTLSSLSVSLDTYESLENAINLLQMLSVVLEGSKIDNGDFENLFGYNKTVNEVNSRLGTKDYTPLSEMSDDLANMFANDANIIRQKLEFIKKVIDINLGSKMNINRDVELNKNYLLYKRLGLWLIGADLLDWDDFDKLLEAYKAAELLKQNTETEEYVFNVTPEQRTLVEKEMLGIEDALYNFFLTNSEKLNDPKVLSKLFKGIDVFSRSNVLLTQHTKENDDSAFIWWLASKAAIKKTDFLLEYKQVMAEDLHKLIAPNATQLLDIELNYASVVNRDIFRKFGDALKVRIKEEWSSKTPEERKQIAQSLGQTLDTLLQDVYNEYVLSIIPAFKYKNITFVEGVPGFGKTTGVFLSTIVMLKRFHGDSDLLKNVYIAHGVSQERAVLLAKDLGFDTSDSEHIHCFGVYNDLNTSGELGIIDYLAVQPKHIQSNEEIPDTEFTYNKNKETVSTRLVQALSNPPSLVIIDEVSDFNAFDLDVLEKSGLLYGFSTLLCGDLDQSGFKGSINLSITVPEVDVNGNPTGNTVTSEGKTDVRIDRANFIRSYKGGISMRTSSNQKSKNNAKILAYLLEHTDKSTVYTGLIELSYCVDDNGVHGDFIVATETHLREQEDLDSYETETGSDFERALELIADMVSKLQPDEKISLITNLEDSPIEKYLKETYGEDKILVFKGTSAKGLEGRYYIMELSLFDSLGNVDSSFDEDFYTGFTRSSESSITFTDSGAFKNAEEEVSVDESYNPAIIAKEVDYKLNTYNEILQDNGSKIQYTKPSTETPVQLNLDEVLKQLLGLKIGDVFYTPRLGDKKCTIVKFTKKNGEDAIEYTVEGESQVKTWKLSSFVTSPDVLLTPPTSNPPIPPSGPAPSGAGPTPVSITLLGNQFLQTLHLKIGDTVYDTNGGSYEIIGFVDSGSSQDFKIKTTSDNGEIMWSKEDFSRLLPLKPTILMNPPAPASGSSSSNTPSTASTLNASTNVQVQPRQDSGELHIGFYTSNTFETGVLWDEDGNPIPIGNQALKRIDSVNGLMKIISLDRLQNWRKANYMQMINQIRFILKNETSRQNIESKLLELFAIVGYTGRVSIRFGLESNAIDRQDRNSTLYIDNPGYEVFGRTNAESVEMYLGFEEGSSNLRIPNKKITCFIALESNGGMVDSLSIPFASLSNPFTIASQVDPNTILYKYPDLIAVIGGVLDTRGWISDLEIINKILDLMALSGLVKLHNSKPIGKYKDLYNLFLLYKFDLNGVFGIKTNGKFDSEWVPAKNLNYSGSEPIFSDRNQNYKEDTLDPYEVLETPLAVLALNMQFIHTPILISQNIPSDENGQPVMFNGEPLIQIGHPYILQSTDPNIKNPDLMLQQLIDQATGKSNQNKVRIIYVKSPSISVGLYIQNNLLQLITTKNPLNLLDVGGDYTASTILHELFQQPNFVREFMLLLQNSGILDPQTVAQLIASISEYLYANGNEDLRKELMHKQISSIVDLFIPAANKLRVTVATFLGSTVGHLKNLSGKSFAQRLLTFIANLKRSVGNEILARPGGLELITKYYQKPIYYRTPIDKLVLLPNGMWLAVQEMTSIGASEYSINIGGESLPFTVLGKTDSNYYFGPSADLIEGFLSLVYPSGNVLRAQLTNALVNGNFVAGKDRNNSQPAINPTLLALKTRFSGIDFNPNDTKELWSETLRKNGILSFVSNGKMHILDNNADGYPNEWKSGELIVELSNNTSGIIDYDNEFIVTDLNGQLWKVLKDGDFVQILKLEEQSSPAPYLSYQNKLGILNDILSRANWSGTNVKIGITGLLTPLLQTTSDEGFELLRNSRFTTSTVDMIITAMGLLDDNDINLLKTVLLNKEQEQNYCSITSSIKLSLTVI